MTPIVPPKGLQRVALIDADLYAYRVGFVTENKPEDRAKAMLTNMLGEILAEPWCTDFELCLTGPTNFRNDVAVSLPYKGGRSPEKPLHFTALRQHMLDMGASVSIDEEADDVVAYSYLANPEDYVMVHVDKDIDQVPGYHYNPVKKVFYAVSSFEGIRNFYTQLLVGDRTDNIFCIDGVGPKTAVKILAGLATPSELYNAVFAAYSRAGMTKERLIENARLLWLRRVKGEALWLPPEGL